MAGRSKTWRRRGKEVLAGPKQAPKTGKAELWGPASLCECRASRPFGTISPATARDLSVSLVTRSASWLPVKRRRDPTTVLVLRRVATTWLPPRPGRGQLAVGLDARRALSTSPHGIAAKPPDRGTLRLLTPPP